MMVKKIQGRKKGERQKTAESNTENICFLMLNESYHAPTQKETYLRVNMKTLPYGEKRFHALPALMELTSEQHV